MAKQKQDTLEPSQRSPADLAALEKMYSQQQLDRYALQQGYPSFEVLKQADASRSRDLTNNRLIKGAERSAKITAMKELASTAMPGDKYHTAALQGLAKEAGITIPADAPDERKTAIAALKGEAPPESPAPVSTTAPEETETPPSSFFQPMLAPSGPAPGTTPVPAGNTGQASYGYPITPHLGIGGAEITPENPTGNPANPWGAGGLFAGNPTHQAAMNVQAREAAMYPFGPVSPGKTTLYGGSPFDRLVGPNSNPASPTTPAVNVPPHDFVSAPVINRFTPAPEVGGAPTAAPLPGQAQGWNVHPGSSLIQQWLAGIVANRDKEIMRRREPVY